MSLVVASGQLKMTLIGILTRSTVGNICHSGCVCAGGTLSMCALV